VTTEQLMELCLIAYLTVLCGYGALGLRFAAEDEKRENGWG